MNTYHNGPSAQFWEDVTYDRLLAQYGAARARLIRDGQDPRTQIDLNKWSSLGSRRSSNMTEQHLSLWRHDTMPPPRPTMQAIIERVAEKYGLTVEDIKGPKVGRRYSIPRQEFFYEAHKIGRSYPQAGTFCGGRDHSTAINGKRRHEARLAEAALAG